MKSPKPKAIDSLRGALFDEDSQVRKNAAAALAILGWTPESSDKIISELRFAVSRERALEALAVLKWKPTDPTLRALYAVARGAYDEAAREGAIGADALVRALIDERAHPGKAVDALALIGANAVPVILGAFVSDRRLCDPHHHWTAKRSLTEALGKIKDPRSVDLLVRMCQDKANIECDAAVDALRGFNEPRVLDVLLICAEADSSVHVRRAALDAALATVGQVAAPKVLGALLRIAQCDVDSGVRRTALDALNRLAEIGAIDLNWARESKLREKLKELKMRADMLDLQSGSLEVRRQALQALLQTPGEDVVAALANLLKQWCGGISGVDAANGLAEIGTASCAAPLLEAIKQLVASNDPRQARDYANALCRVLLKSARDTYTDELRAIAELGDVRYCIRRLCDDLIEDEGWVDLSKLRSIAKQELSNREKSGGATTP